MNHSAQFMYGDKLAEVVQYTKGEVMNVAIYARVSTKSQDTGMQTDALVKYAADRNMAVVKQYIDAGWSGSKESRPALDQLMADAHKRKFDAVLVWKFDRFARSVKHLVTSLEEFQHLGIAFVSFSENLDTSSPMGKAMFAVIAAMAQLERDLIRERVTAGVRRVRDRRGHWGPRAKELPTIPAGSVRQVAALLGVSRETIRRRRAALKGEAHV